MISQISAKVIADSVSSEGSRLTTMELRFHRFILAELNTHRKFSRNSASSRAVPIQKQIEQVRTDPAIPIEFGTRQPGMQAGPPLEDQELDDALEYWLESAENACIAATRLDNLGVHKQVVNRLLEPYLWHTAIVSSTEWDNFFSQRLSPLAQPEFGELAQKMHEAITRSSPVERTYDMDNEMDFWHLPYVSDEERAELGMKAVHVSTARCARVSYLTHDGNVNVAKDLELYDKLTTANPPHYSPMEHPARPLYHSDVTSTITFDEWSETNFDGWMQWRQVQEWIL